MNRRAFLFGTAATLIPAALPAPGLSMTLQGTPGRGFTYVGTVTGRMSSGRPNIQELTNAGDKVFRAIIERWRENEVRDMRRAEDKGSSRALPLVVGDVSGPHLALVELDAARAERAILSCPPQLFVEAHGQDKEEGDWFRKYMMGDDQC